MYADPLLKVRNTIKINPIFERQIGGEEEARKVERVEDAVEDAGVERVSGESLRPRESPAAEPAS